MVKLRYSTGREGAPGLWAHMTNYTKQMASLFDGFRLDNFHNTPLNAAEELLTMARKTNPNLYVFTELFTNSAERDSIYCKRAGAHGLTRECLNQLSSISDFTSHILHFTHCSFDVMGSFRPYRTDELMNYNYINTKLPDSIFFDVTHDNKSYFDDGKFFYTLPVSAILAFSQTANGTTKGYDEFYPKALSVVSETRIYESRFNVVSDLNIMERPVNFSVSPAQLGRSNESITSIEVRGDWNNWTSGHLLNKGDGDFWTCKVNMKLGEHKFKYIINNSDWCYNPFQDITANDTDESYNNTVTVQNTQKLHNNLVNIKKTLNSFNEKMQKEFPFIHTETRTEDIVTIIRQGDVPASSFMVLVKCSKGDGQGTSEVTIDLPGRLAKVHNIWNFHGHFD